MVKALSPGELPEYAQELLSEVLTQTGYPLMLAETDGLGYDSQLRMAGPTQPFHALSYVPAHRRFGVHFLVNAAVKIRRFFELPSQERLLPVSKQGVRLPKEYENELRRKLRGPPEAVLAGLSCFLYEGTVRQLTSMPLDIRVEREIAAVVPDHKAAQRAYLARQVKDLEPHFLPEVADVAPDHIYAASTGMNVVLAEEAAEIAGIEPGPMFRQTPHRQLGERLRELLRGVEEPGYRGDRLVTDAWAQELGLRDWYEWKPMSEVR